MECSDNEVCSSCAEGYELNTQTNSCGIVKKNEEKPPSIKKEEKVSYLLQRLPSSEGDPKFYYKIQLEEEKFKPDQLSTLKLGISNLDTTQLSIRLSTIKSLEELAKISSTQKFYTAEKVSITKSNQEELIFEYLSPEADIDLFSMVIQHESILVGEDQESRFYLKETNSFYESPLLTSQNEKNLKMTPTGFSSVAESQASISTSMEYGSSLIALIFSTLSMDPTGVALEFNRFLDLVKIFRFFGFWFGVKVNKFVDSLGGSSSTNEPKAERIRRVLNGEIEEKSQDSRFHRYKFDKYNIPLQYEGEVLYMGIIYVALWVVKISRILFFSSLKRRVENDHRTRVGKWEINLVVYLRLIHFVGFGVVMMKLLFYNTRIILHRKGGEAAKALCYLTTTLLVIDIMELLSAAHNLNYQRVSQKL